ncbi:MAG: hypothetical protein LBO00_02430 [Zoogloeaceae bacterium]|jgi:hypothetical protein|nr:hypothetical protein [Zoogloeaceae bacterium]
MKIHPMARTAPQIRAEIRTSPLSQREKARHELLPQAALNSKTPMDAMNMWYVSHLNSSSVHLNHPGCETQEYSGDCLYKRVIADAEAELKATRRVTDPGGCFIAGTLVHTREGLRPIEEIKVGDYVLSKPEDGCGEPEYKRVLKTLKFEEKEVWYVQVMPKSEYDKARQERRSDNPETYRHLIVTPNHPFWVKDVGWTRVDQLEIMSYDAFLLLEMENGELAVYRESGPIKQTAKTDIGWGQLLNSDGYGIVIDLSQKGKSAEYLDWQDGASVCENLDLDWEAPENAYCCTVHNLEVEDFHTYFVGNYGIWVHNQNCVTYYTFSRLPKNHTGAYRTA